MKLSRFLALCVLWALCLLPGGRTWAAPRTPDEERFAKADARLNVVYGRLLKKLAPAAQRKLRQEERAWIVDERDRYAHTDMEKPDPYKPLTLLEGQTAATEARIEVLQKQLEAITDPALPVPGGNYTGRYERPTNPAGFDFGLDVQQTGKKAHVSFGATKIDGSGAAPMGEAEGTIDEAGILTFPFEDSFSNKGTGTLALKKGGYQLNMDVTEVVDPRCLRLYGEIPLRRKAARKTPVTR